MGKGRMGRSDSWDPSCLRFPLLLLPALLDILLFHWALSFTLLANKVNDPYSGCPYAANIIGFVSANCVRTV